MFVRYIFPSATVIAAELFCTSIMQSQPLMTILMKNQFTDSELCAFCCCLLESVPSSVQMEGTSRFLVKHKFCLIVEVLIQTILNNLTIYVWKVNLIKVLSVL